MKKIRCRRLYVKKLLAKHQLISICRKHYSEFSIHTPHCQLMFMLSAKLIVALLYQGLGLRSVVEYCLHSLQPMRIGYFPIFRDLSLSPQSNKMKRKRCRRPLFKNKEGFYTLCLFKILLRNHVHLTYHTLHQALYLPSSELCHLVV